MMKQLTLLAFFMILYGCQPTYITSERLPEKLKFNEIQFIGSHNSYKQAIDGELLEQIRKTSGALADSLDYFHWPIQAQLDHGLRKIELDIYLDSEGGLFANPLGLKMVNHGAPYVNDDMKEPGLKVLHVQDLDFRSHCPLFKSCLQTLVNWSAHNPNHFPLIITINAKDEVINQPGFVQPLKFNKQAWLIVDQEIRSGLGPHLYTPDDLRGKEATLPDAISRGWPALDSMRGKILVVLDHSDEKLSSYVSGHKALRGRAMFVNAKEDTPEAAILIVNDPVSQYDYIQSLVKAGYVVRTRADADTKEARSGSTTRRDKAFESGAQIISTDYYVDDARFEPHYEVSLPGGAVALCNPVLAASECRLTDR